MRILSCSVTDGVDCKGSDRSLTTSRIRQAHSLGIGANLLRSAPRLVTAGARLGVAIQADAVAGDLVAGGRAAEFAGTRRLVRMNFVERW